MSRRFWVLRFSGLLWPLIISLYRQLNLLSSFLCLFRFLFVIVLIHFSGILLSECVFLHTLSRKNLLFLSLALLIMCPSLLLSILLTGSVSLLSFFLLVRHFVISVLHFPWLLIIPSFPFSWNFLTRMQTSYS